MTTLLLLFDTDLERIGEISELVNTLMMPFFSGFSNSAKNVNTQ